MRITKTKYYTLELRSGVQVIATGYKAANERPYIIDEFNPAFMTGNPSFELHDGHIQGHRPITTSIREALAFLDINKFSFVSLIN